MAYIPPSLRIYQNLELVPSGNSLPLYACVIAPQYGLHRYAVESEQALLGAYDVASGNTFTTWPDKHAGSVIDLANTKIIVKDAMLSAATNSLTGTGYDPSHDGLLVSGGNEIRSNDYVFVTANGHARSAAFGNRDVQPGDPIRLTIGAAVTDCTVVGFRADVTDASVGSATAGSANASITSAHVDIVATALGTRATVTGSASGYKGIINGLTSDTYTVTVLETDGAIAGSIVRISSLSGTDNVASQVLLASGVANALGTMGATFTVTNGTPDPATIYLVVGDVWTVTPTQTYALPAPAATGDYTGGTSTSYVVTITRGGTVDTDTIKFSSTTLNGADGISEQAVTSSGNYSVGSYGTELTFTTGKQFVKGDKFLVPVTTAVQGPIKTLILSKKLTGVLSSAAITMRVGIRKTIELAWTNWTATAATITVVAGAVQDETIEGVDGVYPVITGTLYVDYREKLSDNASAVQALTSIADVETTLGPISVDNPLALGVYGALQASNGVAVYYIATLTEDIEGYSVALDKCTDINEPYSFVPYSADSGIRDLVAAFVNERSSPETAQFAIAWFGIDDSRVTAQCVVDSTAGVIYATVAGDIVTAPMAEFVQAGVRSGDTVRINYRPDNTGTTIWDEYVIDTVDTDTGLTLLTALTVPITPAVKMEVWRTATETEYAHQIAAVATGYKDRRVYTIWSESVSAFGLTGLPKFAACAALAGMRSAMAPHQPMTNVTVTGIDLVYNVNFGSTLLNYMAGNGVWLIVKDTTGNVYSRHQVSTDNTDINRREQTITTNLDSICRDYRDNFKDLYGRGNVSPAMLELIRSRVHSITGSISSRSFPDYIGPQLLDLIILRLEVDPLLRDQVWLEVEPTLPYPMNNLNIKFRIV